ncbi:hypothetical protein KKF64_00880 [Patescibacteria group bacterium]|nr:hypothetical protein [Patescibacteria group bacterium]
MYITAHAAAGAAIGQFMPSVLFAFIAGFVSHLILDMIPHGDEWIKDWKLFRTKMQRTTVAALIDLCGVIAMTIYWINHSDVSQLPYMLAGIAGAIAPDALWGLYELTKSPILKWYKIMHRTGHYLVFKTRLTVIQGFILQIPLVIALTWIIMNY